MVKLLPKGDELMKYFEPLECVASPAATSAFIINSLIALEETPADTPGRRSA
jgi:hypothetical protein